MSSETPEEIQSVIVWALNELDALFATMSSAIPPAKFVDVGGAKFYRHGEYSLSLACFLKGVKVVSTLNAAAILIAFGYAQEVGILCRVADDCCGDIIFLALPEKEGGQRKLQFITDFFQEEFANVKNPLDSRNKRQNFPRSKIHSAFSDAAKDFLNPSDGQKTQATLHGGLSGYVHGAYPHIMELYGGLPPRFHLKGTPGSPIAAQTLVQLRGILHRAIMASEIVAITLERDDFRTEARRILLDFEARTGYQQQNPNDIVRRSRGAS